MLKAFSQNKKSWKKERQNNRNNFSLLWPTVSTALNKESIKQQKSNDEQSLKWKKDGTLPVHSMASTIPTQGIIRTQIQKSKVLREKFQFGGGGGRFPDSTPNSPTPPHFTSILINTRFLARNVSVHSLASEMVFALSFVETNEMPNKSQLFMSCPLRWTSWYEENTCSTAEYEINCRCVASPPELDTASTPHCPIESTTWM